MRARAIPDFRSPHVPLALLGAILVWTTSIAGSGFSLLALPFALWSTTPYGGLWIVGRMAPRPWPILGAGAAAIAADLGIRASVFLWPRGSTAAIALVFSPAYITTFVMPIGAAAGWLFGTMWRWHLVGRIVTVIVGPLVLGLLMLGLARPELFPTTVIARRAVLERIGPPRIVAGAATIESVRVSTKAAWYQASDLDGQPGDELAIIEHSGVDVLDSTTLDVRSHVPFGGEPGRLWGSFSTLVRFPDQRLGVAQTGGGYSRTRVQDLNGAELWEYHPDPKLSPDALRPADLEGDGRVEFYGSSTTFLARLDEGGREVWRRPTALAALLATLPRTSESPAWIVAVEYGRKVLVWDADGRLLMDRPATAADSPLSAVDTSSGRALIHGGRSARAYDLSGKPLFDVPLGDFTLSYVTSARLTATGVASLVLVGTTDRDTSRYRLLIVDSDRRTVYDEIFDRYPRVIVARRADGSDAVFVHDAIGLRLLRPR